MTRLMQRAVRSTALLVALGAATLACDGRSILGGTLGPPEADRASCAIPGDRPEVSLGDVECLVVQERVAVRK